MRRVMWGYLTVVCTTTAAYFLVPGLSLTVVYDAIAVSAVVAIFAGFWRHRPDPSLAWILIALGVAALACGDLLFGFSQPVPSTADMLYISSYPLFALGLIGLAPRPPAERKLTSALSAAGITVLIGVVSWAFIILPTDGEGSLSSKVVAIGYPVMDVVLLGLLIRVIRDKRTESATLWLFGLGISLFFLADVAYAVNDFGTDYSLGGVVDVAWLLSYAFLGATLLHPAAEGRRTVDTSEREVEWVPPAYSGGGVATMTRPRSTQGFAVRTVTDNLRFATVVGMVGKMLLALAITTMLFGAKMLATDMVLLAGAYGIIGGVLWVASRHAA